jgi:uncharacterized protein DUF6090
MAKPFTNIRKKLVSEKPSTSRTTNYLKYAIGEIILVVIGILIALSINTWNENRKDRIFEIKMLTQIQKALDSDIKYFNRQENRLQKLDSASNTFIKLVHKKAFFKDTLYNKGFSRWYYLRTGINIQFNTGPYEALKSSGIDKISNDSLRNSLVNFYDFEFPRRIALIKYYDRNYDKEVAILKSFLGEPYTELVNGKVEVYSKFPEDLFLKTDFLNFLTSIKSRATNSKTQITRSIKIMKRLRNQIDTEIKQ